MKDTVSKLDPASPIGGAVEYEKSRYRHLDQRIINRIEHRLIDRLLDASGTEGRSILNVPCGYGRFSEILDRRYGRICCFDIQPEILAMAVRRHDAASVFGVNGSIRRLPFADRSFDMIMSIRFFHHYFEDHDRVAMLRELRRVSRKSLLITYYARNFLHELTRRVSGMSREIIMLDRGKFLQELASVGFRPIIEKAPLSFLHAQRFLLLEKNAPV
jgi:ubiquinone/menaquinone biosynthesis C-methylase UbiE